MNNMQECCWQCQNLMFSQMLMYHPFTCVCTPSEDFALRCDFANAGLCNIGSKTPIHPWFESGEPQWIYTSNPLWHQIDPRIPKN